jgi:hypothetical protein
MFWRKSVASVGKVAAYLNGGNNLNSIMLYSNTVRFTLQYSSTALPNLERVDTSATF